MIRIRKIVLLLALASLFYSCRSTPAAEERRLIYDIIGWLKIEEFGYAKKEGNLLKLRDSNYKYTRDILIPKQILDSKYFKKILYIRKKESVIYFILYDWSGDESGLVYSPDGRVDMNGIMQMQKVDGHLYYFQTWL
jgi:hypothetical protein